MSSIFLFCFICLFLCVNMHVHLGESHRTALSVISQDLSHLFLFLAKDSLMRLGSSESTCLCFPIAFTLGFKLRSFVL